MKKIYKYAALLMFLSACAVPFGGTFNFSGPISATEQDFVNAFYQCAQDASGLTGENSSTGTQIIQSITIGASKQLPSCSMMRVCMAANGYRQDPSGRFDSSSIAVACTP